MLLRQIRLALAVVMATMALVLFAPIASATPVCTDGYMGGPPLEACGGRVFPEAENSLDYVQYLPDPATRFSEYQHGIEYLAELYPRWVSVFTLSDLYNEPDAVSIGPDGRRSTAKGDTGDGYDIFVVKLSDNTVSDEGKENLLFSLSVHGDEIGGREGGLRAIEDLAMAAENGGTIADGVEGYESTTGVQPEFHEYEVADVLSKEAVYFIDFNIDGWVKGDHFAPVSGVPDNVRLYTRGNWVGTDLNRQMPTVGSINTSRNPLEESEMLYGHKFMHEVAAAGVGGQLAYGADIHGESQSRAFIDIMYPAGQFDSVKHRRLMSIAERTKSVVDDTLFDGIQNMIEENTGGDAGEGIEDYGAPGNVVPTKPARWGTVWDTLGYTDTGFIGDYLATELGVTGMDYEMALNHADYRAHSRVINYPMFENLINGSRAIIKTAMAYAMTEREDFADFSIDPGGEVGYLFDPRRVTDTDENGSGTLPGPLHNGVHDGIGQNGKPVEQKPYSASQLDFFEDEAPYIVGGIQPVNATTIAASASSLNHLDTLVLADIVVPAEGSYDPAAFYANLKSWVESGGNLVLTDRSLHVLEGIGFVPAGSVTDIKVYQPYANIADHDHPMVEGLRGNARQLAEATLVGYPIGNNASPMSVVTKTAWETAGGHTVGTTGNNAGTSDGGTQTSVGEAPLGDGIIRILGGGLPTPTEEFDHRYGLKDYALTYSGLFILENSMKYDSDALGAPDGTPPPGGGGPPPPGGEGPPPPGGEGPPFGVFSMLALIPIGVVARRRWRR